MKAENEAVTRVTVTALGVKVQLQLLSPNKRNFSSETYRAVHDIPVVLFIIKYSRDCTTF